MWTPSFIKYNSFFPIPAIGRPLPQHTLPPVEIYTHRYIFSPFSEAQRSLGGRPWQQRAFKENIFLKITHNYLLLLHLKWFKQKHSLWYCVYLRIWKLVFHWHSSGPRIVGWCCCWRHNHKLLLLPPPALISRPSSRLRSRRAALGLCLGFRQGERGIQAETRPSQRHGKKMLSELT